MLLKILKPDLIYCRPNIIWDSLLPPEHRPNGTRERHDDLGFWPLNTIRRTLTSFILVNAEVLEGNPDWFMWQGKKYPKPWCKKGFHQKTLITYQCPITNKVFMGIYKSSTDTDGFATRRGPRLSDDLENGPGYVYVNKMPGPDFLTFGTKQI